MARSIPAKSKSKAAAKGKTAKKRPPPPAKKPFPGGPAPDPVLPLKNPQHEELAQARAGGVPWHEAMRRAGYKNATNAPRLANRPEISGRISHLIGRNSAVSELTRHGLMRDLITETSWDPAEMFVDLPDGSMAMKKITDMPVHIRRLIQGIEIDTVPQGEDRPPITRTKIKLTCRQKARDQLARMIGAYEPDNRQKQGPPAVIIVPQKIQDPVKWAESVVLDQQRIAKERQHGK